MRRYYFDTLIILMVLLLFVFFIALKAKYIIYNSTSSYPTGLYQLSTGEYKKGDLVVICADKNTNFIKQNFKLKLVKQNFNYCSKYTPLLKKIVASEGDEVSVKKNGVFINDILLRNSMIYEKMNLEGCLGTYKLRKNQVFVMSDYNPKSYDSRYFCALEYDDIIAKAKKIRKSINDN